MAKYVDHLGNEFKNKEEMCRHYNISDKAFHSRRKYGWSLEKALTTPLSKKPKTRYDFK